MLRRPSSDEDRFSPVRPARAESEDFASFAPAPPSTPPTPRRVLRLSVDDDARRSLRSRRTALSRAPTRARPRAPTSRSARRASSSRCSKRSTTATTSSRRSPSERRGATTRTATPRGRAASALEPRYPLRDPPAWMRAAGLADRAALARKAFDAQPRRVARARVALLARCAAACARRPRPRGRARARAPALRRRLARGERGRRARRRRGRARARSGSRARRRASRSTPTSRRERASRHDARARAVARARARARASAPPRGRWVACARAARDRGARRAPPLTARVGRDPRRARAARACVNNVNAAHHTWGGGVRARRRRDPELPRARGARQIVAQKPCNPKNSGSTSAVSLGIPDGARARATWSRAWHPRWSVRGDHG